MENKELIKKIKKMNLKDAFYEVVENGEYFISDLEELKSTCKHFIDDECYDVAMTILEGLNPNIEFYKYDWSCPDTPTPIETIQDLIDCIEG